MNDYLWGFLIGAVVGAVIMWLNMRALVNENPKPARFAAVCIDRLRLENERLRAALRDISAIGKTPGSFDTQDAIAAVVIANAALRNGE